MDDGGGGVLGLITGVIGAGSSIYTIVKSGQNQHDALNQQLQLQTQGFQNKEALTAQFNANLPKYFAYFIALL